MNFYQSQGVSRLGVISKYRDSQTLRIFTTCRATGLELVSSKVSYFLSIDQYIERRQDTHIPYLKVIRRDAGL